MPTGNRERLTYVPVRYLPLVARQFVERRIGRQRELLHDVVPSATIIHMLVNPNNAGAVQDIPEVALAARGIGLRLQVIPAGTEADIDAAFVKLVSEKARALLVMADGFFTLQRKQIAALAARHALPGPPCWARCLAARQQRLRCSGRAWRAARSMSS
jgi:hypothetical protein